MSAFLASCPADRVPVISATASSSTAVHVEWRSDTDTVSAPVARVTDTPGGPLDRIVADPDVTTFLNDRFHPVFQLAQPGQSASLRFLDGCGCLLRAPDVPVDPAAFIAEANAVMLDRRSRRCLPSPPGRNCADGPGAR
jgi:hypothetical protein